MGNYARLRIDIKRTVLIITIFAVICIKSISGASALSEPESKVYDNFEYYIDGQTVVITGYLGNKRDGAELINTLSTLTFPSEIEGKKVVALGSDIFWKYRTVERIDKIKTIICPEYLKELKVDSFKGMALNQLEEIRLGRYTKRFNGYSNNEMYSGDPVYYKKITVPVGAKYLKVAKNGVLYSKDGRVIYGFPYINYTNHDDRYARNKKITISSKTKRICAYAFQDAFVKEIKIPNSVTKLSKYSFQAYSGIIKVPKKKIKWYRRWFKRHAETAKYITVKGY